MLLITFCHWSSETPTLVHSSLWEALEVLLQLPCPTDSTNGHRKINFHKYVIFPLIK